MLDWKLIAFTAPIFFVTYQSLSKLLPKGISVFLVAAYASLVGFFFMLSLHLLFQSDKSVRLSTRSLALALGMGLLISLGNFGIIKSFSLGAPQSSFSLFFYVPLIIYGIIFGIVFWHEKLQFMQVVGILLSLIGIYIVFRFKQ